MLADVPDYTWHAGCFGTAAGNLIGYWDRHGLPNMYAGQTGGGVAPLTSRGANASIRALWASQQGLDGRPANQPGHMEDYWQSYDTVFSFESTAPDPYAIFQRPEHTPDSLGDFMGQSQRKYKNLNDECDGNIDGFAFNFWDNTGNRRTNFTPPLVGGAPVRDIQSGLREWSRYRGYETEVSSQLADVNPAVLAGLGFTFEDIKVEINAGYPVMLVLQNFNEFYRVLTGMPRANPLGHAILVHGYVTSDGGEVRAIRYKSSWGEGDKYSEWNSDIIIAELPLRGAITYRPQPKITNVERAGNQVRVQWEGPNSVLIDDLTGVGKPVHQYVVERATTLGDGTFAAVTSPANGLEASFTDDEAAQAFFRVRLVAN